MPTTILVKPIETSGLRRTPFIIDSINMWRQTRPKVLSPAPRTSRDIEDLKIIAMIFGGGGFLVSLFLLTYGVDLGPGFF